MNLANKITMVRICMIPLFMIFFTEYPGWLADANPVIRFMDEYGTYIAVAIFIIASATDKLDGYVARKYNLITNLGKLLDPLADKLLISVALIMMVQVDMIPSWIAIVIIAREFAVTGLRMIATAQGIALAADHFGKWKMVSQVIAIAAVLLNNYPFEWFTQLEVDRILMVIAVALTVYSGYHYFAKNYKFLQLNG